MQCCKEIAEMQMSQRDYKNNELPQKEQTYAD